MDENQRDEKYFIVSHGDEREYATWVLRSMKDIERDMAISALSDRLNFVHFARARQMSSKLVLLSLNRKVDDIVKAINDYKFL